MGCYADPLRAAPALQSRAQGEVGTLRQRCASLAGQLQEAQRSAAQLQVCSGCLGLCAF